MLLHYLAVIAASLLLVGCSSLPQTRISNTSYGAEAVKPFVDSGELPGAITVFYNNGLQENTVLGWADRDKKLPMGMDKMFMQCSQTKGFCGVTVAILIEEGKLSLDDPVAKYLPEFKELKVKTTTDDGKTAIVPAKNVLTLRMALNHTGGFAFEIPTKSKNGITTVSLRDTAREAAATPLLFEPGTKVKYSDTGIDIAAAVIEVVTGKPWEVFLKERVLDPLEMFDTTFKPTDEQLKRAMALYIVAKGKKAKYRHFHPAFPRPYNGDNVHPSAGGGLWTTANDQLKFYKMLMNLGKGENNKRILREETVKNLLAVSSRPQKMGNYSLGLKIGKDDWFGHGGAWGTACWVNWKNRQLRMLIVQVNGDRPWQAIWNKASEKFFATSIDSQSADAYTGRTQ